MWVLALAMSVNQPGAVLREGFDQWGAAPPAAWTSTGTAAVSDEGHLGGKCIAVTGDGTEAGSSSWRVDLPLEAGRTYRVTFWARNEGSGGSATSGPDSVNRDYGVAPDWERYSSVCRIPDNAAPTTTFHLGQWCVKGTMWFDDVEVLPVEPVACDPSGLGEGESTRGASYRFASMYEAEGANDARPLRSATATFNSNRWWLHPDTEVTYAHELPDASQTAGVVSVSVGYHQAGAVIAEASADGVRWTELGRVDALGAGRWDVPTELYPARTLLVRLRGSDDANLQVHSYAYDATLDRDAGFATGRTLYMTLEKQEPGIEARIREVLPTGIRVDLTSRGAASEEWSVRASLGSSEPSSQTLSLTPGTPASVLLPLQASHIGLQELVLEAARGDEVRYRAAAFLPVTVLSLTDYGEALTTSGPLTCWWCDATRKVAQDRPLPERVSTEGIRIAAAGGEYEPFQLVLSANEALEGTVSVAATDIVGPEGARIAASNVSIEQVEYVEVKTPTDATGCRGLWPDPLPPVTAPLEVTPGKNVPLWVRVFVPKGTPAGAYQGSVVITQADGAALSLPVSLRVFGFDMPDKPHVTGTFGFDSWAMQRYHNVETSEEREAVWDAYMRNFAEHRMSPYDPMALHPYRLRFEGRGWTGLTTSTDDPAEGATCARIVDASADAAITLSSQSPITVDRAKPLVVRWAAKTLVKDQQYQVTVSSHDARGNFLPGRNIDVLYTGGPAWARLELTVEAGRLPAEARAVSLSFRPCPWTEAGDQTGTMWVDDVFLGEPDGDNLLEDPGFEVAATVPKAEIDWADFDAAAERYLNEMGMPVFAVSVPGLGTGTFYSRTPGEMAGYAAGTPEYAQVMDDYLGQIEAHLKEKGWLDRTFVYWFDEPDPKDYDFVREGMETIRRGAPGLSRMLTEQPEDALVGSVDIWCPITPEFRLEPARARMAEGERFWWYVCTGPKAPWCTLFIDHPATDLRVWLWQTFGNGITGILVWATNYWTSIGAYPDVPQNPWTDPMSYVSGYGTKPGQIGYWGNGDGRFFYPPNRDPSNTTTKYIEGPVNSLRWEMLREGIEDYEYLATLQDLVTQAEKDGMPDTEIEKYRELLKIPASITTSAIRYTVDSTPIYEQRIRVAEAIEELKRELGR